MLARLGGAARAVVVVGGEALLHDELLGWIRVPRVAGPFGAALDAGVAAVRAAGSARTDRPFDAIVFATPALASWRTEECAFVDRSALAIVARTRGAAGWHVELDEQSTLRDGLLVISRELWEGRAGALAAAESWSDFEARLRESGAPVFDLRALRRLVDAGLAAPSATAGLASGLTRALARLAGLGQEVEPRFKLDEKRLPRQVRHGESVEVELSGWVALLPQPAELELRVGDRRVSIPVDVARPDVLLRFPDVGDDRCGFRFAGEIGPLPPGRHEARLVVPFDRAERELGTVRVGSRLELLPERVATPSTFDSSTGLPLLIEGQVIASHPPVRLEIRLDDAPLEERTLEPDPPAATDASERSSRPARLGFRYAHTVESPGSTPRHLLLRAFDARGRSTESAIELETEPGAARPATVHVEPGARDPRTGRLPVHVHGVLFAPAPDARIVVRGGESELGSMPLVTSGGSATSGTIPIHAFDLRLEPRLEPGEHELSVALVGEEGERLLDRRRLDVRDAAPELRIERLELEVGDGDSAHLRIEGAIDRANLADSLRVQFDDRALDDVDPRSFTVGTGDPLAERRRFLFARPLSVPAAEAGEHSVRIELRRGTATLSEWRGTVRRSSRTESSVEIVSADLDRLRRGSPAPVWSALAIDGEVRGAPPGSEVALLVDGVESERAKVTRDGTFHLDRRLEPGAHAAALEVARGAERVARSASFEIVVRRFEIPERWARDLDEVRAALGKFARRIEGMGSRDLLRRHLESRLDETGDFAAALAALAARARLARERPGRIVRDLPPPPSKPLRILLASWEIPWSGHGGGVAVVNLLRHAGPRHEIVLIHPVHAGAEGLSEEVRPFVREILSIPRDWSRPQRPAPFGVPEALLPTHTPALAGAIAGELAGGAYDLADFEFAGLYFHAARGATPSLLVDLDVASFGRAVEEPSDDSGPLTERSAAAWMRELLGALAFDALALPERADRIAVVSEPEALFLLPFAPERELFVSPLAVDVERLAARAAEAREHEPSSFVFVGNFRHAPNRRTAKRWIERLAPKLRARIPAAKLILAGAGLPPELRDAARAAGVECPGAVADLERLYGAAIATLAPIESGGGTRVKLLEAMACGCPVVSTALGTNGIAARDGEELLLAESDDEFADAAARLARDPGLRTELARKAAALVEREHSIAVQGERRERIWAATIAAKRREG